MAARIVICLGDNAVAHIVAARLAQRGVDAVVVETAAQLAVVAMTVEDGLVVDFTPQSGVRETQALRRVRIALGTPLPTVCIHAADLPVPERTLLEKQYRVRFLAEGANPATIAEAAAQLLAASASEVTPPNGIPALAEITHLRATVAKMETELIAAKIQRERLTAQHGASAHALARSAAAEARAALDCEPLDVITARRALQRITEMCERALRSDAGRVSG